jgi:non-ribosomal peptide synthetase component E (peptide arylation enzyme)
MCVELIAAEDVETLLIQLVKTVSAVFLGFADGFFFEAE